MKTIKLKIQGWEKIMNVSCKTFNSGFVKVRLMSPMSALIPPERVPISCPYVTIKFINTGRIEDGISVFEAVL